MKKYRGHLMFTNEEKWFKNQTQFNDLWESRHHVTVAHLET